MVQLDSIRVDVDSTLAKAERLYSKKREIVLQEAAFLRRSDISLVVVDIPALPLEAASFIGIPRVAIGNFGWNWIYSDFVPQNPKWKPIVYFFQEAYEKTDLLLRLPFCEKMQVFPNIEDIPLVASPGICRRAKIEAMTGSNPAKKWILLSFAALSWTDEALNRVEQMQEYEFFTVRPLEWRRKNIHPLNREQVCFSDIVASVDAVISKPGFGILSDCIVNRKPLIYVDRSHFLEYSILKSAIEKHLQHIHIPSAELYRGELRDTLRNIWNCPNPDGLLQHDGAAIAAQRIVEFAELASAR
jgi:hypothetical protein